MISETQDDVRKSCINWVNKVKKMKTYTFEVVCTTGVNKTSTFEVENFTQARRLSEQFVDAN